MLHPVQISVLFGFVMPDTSFQQFDCFSGPSGPSNPKLLSALLVIGHEKFFKLRKQRLADIIDRRQVFVIVGVDCYTK
jgi:hypothetical protein